ncbi:hypothetical protein [Enterococcus gilvus]|uniref:Uncharacterized protein n=1 Tax=Enterococcus gilvus ATCC BAA-350 TaxID=1158614 RepID=R2XAE3_9ENTE|nr:hypothetical protein [Enterococcus gilvus]EOI51588.1 hypothetical protein UKC_04129 [Enterococcus gilvus ATCC BAA-350]EOW78411.1 hypothetical protein I592_04004 [Enterococcus gilvus ATCC BAA-350]OJG40602.1 hypothetical protein RV02_GL001979 [Enterococcus gilvus]
MGQFEKAKKRFNGIMMTICCEHMTIGTGFSEEPQLKSVKEMVEECEYWLSCYYEGGHTREKMRHEEEEERKRWRSEVGKLKRFIEAYKVDEPELDEEQGELLRHLKHVYSWQHSHALDLIYYLVDRNTSMFDEDVISLYLSMDETATLLVIQLFIEWVQGKGEK